VSTQRYQAANQRFTAFFNKLTKARLSGKALAPSIAEAVGQELAQINPAADLPPDAAKIWSGFLDTYISFGAGGDPLAKLTSLPDAEAETAMEQIGEVQQILADAVKKGR
jgi:hypothetical protein